MKMMAKLQIIIHSMIDDKRTKDRIKKLTVNLETAIAQDLSAPTSPLQKWSNNN